MKIKPGNSRKLGTMKEKRNVGEPITIVICGSREFNDYQQFEQVLNGLLCGVNIARIITGGATGPDSMAVTYARKKGIKYDIMRADWSKHGRSAGPIRNTNMAKAAQATIAFWDEKSKGTKDMIIKAYACRHEYVYIHRI